MFSPLHAQIQGVLKYMLALDRRLRDTSATNQESPRWGIIVPILGEVRLGASQIAKPTTETRKELEINLFPSLTQSFHRNKWLACSRIAV